jgi:hypothetical protein
MSFIDFIKKNLMNFFIIVTFISVAMGILGISLKPGTTFGYEAFFSPVIYGAVAMLPSFVFYSRRELSFKQMLLRRILHFVILEATLLIFSFLLGLLDDTETAAYFAASVFIVYLLTNIIRWIIDSKTAGEINKGLKRIKQ